MNEKFKAFETEYVTHLDDPDWLSKAVIQLSAVLYNHNLEMAQAELDLNKKLVMYLDAPTDGKKMSFVESEARSITDTNNGYKAYKVTAEAIVETINSIKKRIEVLSWERRN